MESVTYGLYGFSQVCKSHSTSDNSYLSYFTKILLITLCYLFFTYGSSWAADIEYSIVVPCHIDGQVYIRYSDGTVTQIGKVLAVPRSSRWPSYTASKWAEAGTVCACAVNAIHVLVSVEKGQGRTISILPKETFAPASGKGNAFVVETKAGTTIFGAFSPVVGSKISLIDHTGLERPFKVSELSRKGNSLVINVPETGKFFVMDIENRPGGRVLIWDDQGVHTMARVIRPLGGVGRFGGTQFQNTGRIRANHTGVIDISTSPYGSIGGFQIIPLIHAFSTEMINSWKLTQWMIISSTDTEISLAGQAPLFSGNLVTGTQTGEQLRNLWSTYGRKPLSLCRLNGGKWQRLPDHTGRDDAALKELTHLRLYFPVNREPLAYLN